VAFVLLSYGRYVSVLNCRTRDVIHISAVYLRINFCLSYLTRSATCYMKFLLLLTLQSYSKVVLHCCRSCNLRHQFLTPMFFRSSSTDSRHLNLTFPYTSNVLLFQQIKLSARIHFLDSKELSQPPQPSYFNQFDIV
jgi:hypothetical protein